MFSLCFLIKSKQCAVFSRHVHHLLLCNVQHFKVIVQLQKVPVYVCISIHTYLYRFFSKNLFMIMSDIYIYLSISISISICIYIHIYICVYLYIIYKSIKTSSISQVPWGSRTSRSAVSTVAAHFLGRSAMAAHAAAGRVGQRLGQADGGSGCVSWGSHVIYHEKWWFHRILWWKVVISWKLYDEKWRLNGIWSWRMVIEWRFHGIYHQQWGFWGKWDWIYPLMSSNVARKSPNKRRFLAGKIINEWWIFHCHVRQKVADV